MKRESAPPQPPLDPDWVPPAAVPDGDAPAAVTAVPERHKYASGNGAGKVDSHMTIKEGKAQIVGILEALQKQGVWIHTIHVDWKSVVPAEDVEKPTANTRATLRLDAEL